MVYLKDPQLTPSSCSGGCVRHPGPASDTSFPRHLAFQRGACAERRDIVHHGKILLANLGAFPLKSFSLLVKQGGERLPLQSFQTAKPVGSAKPQAAASFWHMTGSFYFVFILNTGTGSLLSFVPSLVSVHTMQIPVDNKPAAQKPCRWPSWNLPRSLPSPRLCSLARPQAQVFST